MKTLTLIVLLGCMAPSLSMATEPQWLMTDPKTKETYNPSANSRTPEELGRRFCKFMMLYNDIPDFKYWSRNVFEVLGSKSLLKKIDQSWTADDLYLKKHSDSLSLLSDGLMYKAYPDSASSCAVGQIILSKDKAIISLNYIFDNDTTGWIDRIQAIRINKIWYIDNIIYAPKYDYDLRQDLQKIIDDKE